MKLILVALFAVIGLTLAQNPQPSASCLYQDFGLDYLCFLTLNNPDGFDNITAITGTHLENRTDADVTYIFRDWGSTANIPSIICSQFPNLRNLDLTNFGIQTVAENSIAGCTGLTFFRLWRNQITALPENLFVSTPLITYIDIDNNQLTTLPENIFVPLTSLQTLEIRNNPYTLLPGGLFRSQANLSTLIMDGCRISEVNQNWFIPLVNLYTLYIGNNLFTTV